jgi:hypothetical protein
MSIKQQLDQQAKELEELKHQLRIKTIPEHIESPISEALFTVKHEIEMSKQGQASEQLEKIYKDYHDNAPSVVLNDMSNLGRLLEYSVDFIDKTAPTLMKAMQIFSADASNFKHHTCIIFITKELPSDHQLTNEILSALINTVVDLRNRLQHVLSITTDNTVTQVSRKVGKGEKTKNWFIKDHQRD